MSELRLVRKKAFCDFKLHGAVKGDCGKVALYSIFSKIQDGENRIHFRCREHSTKEIHNDTRRD